MKVAGANDKHPRDNDSHEKTETLLTQYDLDIGRKFVEAHASETSCVPKCNPRHGGRALGTRLERQWRNHAST